MRLTLILISAFILSSCIYIESDGDFFDGNDNYTGMTGVAEIRTLDLDASNLSQFNIASSGGSVVLSGRDDITEIHVTADITDYRGELELTLKADGNKAELVSKINHSGRFNWRNSGRINLTIEVPTTMDINIDTGFGAMTVKTINGDVSLDSGSGRVDVDNIDGSLDIDTGSGSVESRNVSQSLIIDTGSGRVEVDNIGKNVTVDTGSGSININNVGGNVSADTGSGGIRITSVVGNVEIDTGSGNVTIDQIQGRLKIDQGSGKLNISNIDGPLVIE